MTSELGRRVLDVLEAEGPELAIAVLARRSGIRPTQLAPILDELHDDGLVRPGAVRASVTLVAVGDGRFSVQPGDHPVRAR